MRILFDQATPVPLRQLLSNHTVSTAYERGWSRLSNGELLEAAEEAGFEMLVITDLNLKYQQNLSSRRIAVLALSTWPRIERAAAIVVDAINDADLGGYSEVEIP